MSKKKTQKILIPKGTINPDEDTLIEVPYSLKSNTLVVAGPSSAAVTNRVDKSTSYYNTPPISKSFIPLPEEARSSKTVYYKQPEDHSQNFSPILRSNVSSSSRPQEFMSAIADLDDMVLPDLYAAEQEERSVMEEKLSAYQQARRQFLFESTRVASKSFQTPNYSMDSTRRHQDSGTDDFFTINDSSRSFKKRPSRSRGEKRSNKSRKVNDEDGDEEEDENCSCSSKANV